MQGATSKMSHNRTVILVVRPLWGRSNEDDLPPQVKTCGYANETPLGSFLHLSLCPLGPQGRFQSEAGKEQVYRSHTFCPLPRVPHSVL